MSDQGEAVPFINGDLDKGNLHSKESKDSSKVNQNCSDQTEVPDNVEGSELDEVSSSAGREVNIPDRRNTDILDCVEERDLEELKRCLGKGSSPEATCDETSMCQPRLAGGGGGAWAPVRRALLLGGCLADLLGRLRKEQLFRNDDPSCGEDVLRYHLCDSTHNCRDINNKINIVLTECTPLHVACARLQADRVLGLLEHGADIARHDGRGRTPLDVLGLAVTEEEFDVKGFDRVVEALIQHGIRDKVDRKKWFSNKDGISPLHIAIRQNAENSIKLLLEHGADPKIKDENGQTPLHLAVLNMRIGILKHLVNSHRGELVELVNKSEETPLQLAISVRWYQGVLVLLEANASIPNQLNNNRDSALHFAARAGDVKILKELIKKLPNTEESIDIPNTFGKPPLFVAIGAGKVSCVEYLVMEGASLIIKGRTVLHEAVETNNCDVLEALLEFPEIVPLLKKSVTLSGDRDQNADTVVVNLNGDTALHIAAEKGYHNMIEIILRKDEYKELAKIRDAKNWLPFHRAAYNCHRESIQLFLKDGSNLSEVIPHTNIVVIDVIKNKMPRSAEFLHDIFNSCITANHYSFDDPKSEIVVNYSMIFPDEDSASPKKPQIDAITALFSSGSDAEIKKLAWHPFIQSFVYLKWNLLQYIYAIIFTVYLIFVLGFTQMTILICDDTWKHSDHIYSLYILMLLTSVLIIENIYVLWYTRDSWLTKYFWRREVWSNGLQLFSLLMASIVLILALYQIKTPALYAAVTHLMCWLQVPIMMSQFQDLGYYIQMYFKVAVKVLKVLLSLGCFLILGFSSIFWILKAHDKTSTFWDSLIKTAVMMTSEFEYSSMVGGASDATNRIFIQTFFLLFLVSVSIVFMTFLLAVAVTDTKDLIKRGRIQRLIEQIVFIRHVELLTHLSVIDMYTINNKLTVYPGISSKANVYMSKGENILPRKIVECLLENIKERKYISEKDQRSSRKVERLERIEKKLDEMKFNLAWIR